MRILIIFSIMLLVLIAPSVSAGEAPLTIYTVNYPLKFFAEQIGGEHVEVYFPAPGDVDPAYWTPDVETIGNYQKADLILLNGAGYAKWVGKVSLPRSKMVDTSKSFRDQYVPLDGTTTHTHGPGGEHAHADTAFTTWLDFYLATEQASAIEAILSRKRPAQKEIFRENFEKFERNLLILDHDIKTLVSRNSAQPLLVSHPVYDYFSRRYNLNIKSVHWEPGELPTNRQIAELQNILKDHPARWMVWEGNPLGKSEQLLMSINIDSLVFDPCGNSPGQGDFLSVMRQNLENLKAAFDL